MGRPVNKRNFGTVAGATDNFTVIADVGTGGIVENAYILSQRATNRFNIQAGANAGICTLVDKSDVNTLGNNEMVIKGYVNGSGDGVTIKKLYNRTCRDFNNNRYTWSIADDSTESIMTIVAI